MPELISPFINHKSAGAPFVFDCFRCGTTIRISEPKTGAKYRCPLCRAKVRFKPRPGRSDGALAPEEVRPHPALRFLLLALALAVLAVGGLGYYGYASNKQKVAEFNRLDRLANANIAEARRRAGSYAFDAAGAIIGQAEAQVEQSPLLNSQSRELLQDRLAVALAELKAGEATLQQKLKEGYRVVGGRLLQPDEADRALAEEDQRDAAEQSRREAEARARAEAEDKARALREAEEQADEEQVRRRREQEYARSELTEALRTLPPIEEILGGFEYTLQRMKMTSMLLSKRLSEVDASKPFDVNEFALGREVVKRRLFGSEAPIVADLRDEITELIANLDFDHYLLSGQDTHSDNLPIQFVTYRDRPTLMIGIALSDSIYNPADPNLDTPQGRAGAFARTVILPALRGKSGPGRIPPSIEYVGITSGYAIGNPARRDDVPETEFVCLVMQTTDLVAFARGNIVEVDLLRNSAAFAATRDEPFTPFELPRE
jgi:DNA-directed RNA polymerase subunit RPC12/RpoP